MSTLDTYKKDLEEKKRLVAYLEKNAGEKNVKNSRLEKEKAELKALEDMIYSMESKEATEMKKEIINEDIKDIENDAAEAALMDIDTGDNDLFSPEELAELEKEVKDIVAPIRQKQEAASRFTPSLAELLSTGQLGDNMFMYYDYTRGRYIYFNKETGERKIFSSVDASHKLFEIFYQHGEVLSNPTKELRFVKKVNMEFNVHKPAVWTNDFGTFVNDFNEKQTKLGEIRAIRKSTKKEDLYTHARQLKDIAPGYYAMQMNLCEYNEEAVDHKINWLSTFVNTRKKILTTFLHVGKQGTGKGVEFKFMRYMFSKDYVSELLASELGGPFNDSIENKLFVNFNEVTSDFSKNDKATQNLKQLIADDTVNINAKNQKAYQAENAFITTLSNNHIHSVKIDQDDRRFNYFLADRTLREVAEEDFGMHVKEFTEVLIPSEYDAVIEFLAKYDFDKERANDLFITDSKRRTQRATGSNIEFFFNLIKNKDIDTIREEIYTLSDMYEDTFDKSKYSDNYAGTIKYKESLISDLEEGFEKDFISSRNMIELYTLLVEDTRKKDDKTIVKTFKSRFSKTAKKRLSGHDNPLNGFDLSKD